MKRNGMSYEEYRRQSIEEAEEYRRQIIEEAKIESKKDYVTKLMEREGLTREEAEAKNNMLNEHIKWFWLNTRVNKKEV